VYPLNVEATPVENPPVIVPRLLMPPIKIHGRSNRLLFHVVHGSWRSIIPPCVLNLSTVYSGFAISFYFYCTWVRARIGEFCRLAHLENFLAENPNDLKPYLRVLAQEIEQVSARNKIQQAILRSFGC
jgi:hypothetical protein